MPIVLVMAAKRSDLRRLRTLHDRDMQIGG